VLISTVYRKKGLMHRRWRELFGNDDADDAWRQKANASDVPVSSFQKLLIIRGPSQFRAPSPPIRTVGLR
jgi:hypothetical protein